MLKQSISIYLVSYTGVLIELISEGSHGAPWQPKQTCPLTLTQSPHSTLLILPDTALLNININ